MNREYTAVRLKAAVDFLQVITEDFEDNFAMTGNNAIKARAGMTISMLYILNDYLRSMIDDATAEESAT